MKNLGWVYLVGEICVLIGMMVFHTFNDLEKSIFLTSPGQLVMGYAFVGIICIILLAVFRSQRRIGSRRFYSQITLLVLGILIPFLVLFFVVSELH